MIATTHFDHYILSTKDGVHIVLDEDAKELKRTKDMGEAMQFCKARHLKSKAEELFDQATTIEQAASQE
jgi:hypothetical protein